jgi:hypothetical protein
MAWVEQSGNNHWRVRFRRDDGTIGSIPGFRNEKAAQDHANDLESDQRRGTWLDPTGGRTTMEEWLTDWWDALDIDTRTEDNYRSIVRNHIVPRWGDTALADITNLKVQAWAKQLRAGHLSPITITGFVKLLSQILTDTAEDKLIVTAPGAGWRSRCALFLSRASSGPQPFRRSCSSTSRCHDEVAVREGTSTWPHWGTWLPSSRPRWRRSTT